MHKTRCIVLQEHKQHSVLLLKAQEKKTMLLLWDELLKKSIGNTLQKKQILFLLVNLVFGEWSDYLLLSPPHPFLQCAH